MIKISYLSNLDVNFQPISDLHILLNTLDHCYTFTFECHQKYCYMMNISLQNKRKKQTHHTLKISMEFHLSYTENTDINCVCVAIIHRKVLQTHGLTCRLPPNCHLNESIRYRSILKQTQTPGLHIHYPHCTLAVCVLNHIL